MERIEILHRILRDGQQRVKTRGISDENKGKRVVGNLK